MQPSPTLSAALTPPHSARRRTPPYTHASVIPHNRPAHFDSRNSPLLPRGTAPPARDASALPGAAPGRRPTPPTLPRPSWPSSLCCPLLSAAQPPPPRAGRAARRWVTRAPPPLHQPLSRDDGAPAWCTGEGRVQQPHATHLAAQLDFGDQPGDAAQLPPPPHLSKTT